MGFFDMFKRHQTTDDDTANKQSMKSTWRNNKKNWSHDHWVLELLSIHPTDMNKPIPVHQKTDKMQYIPEWQGHAWILAHALWPLALEQMFTTYTGWHLPWWAAFFYYGTVFKINAIHELQMLKVLGHRHGFLDGDVHERDQLPDNAVAKTLRSLSHTADFRPLMSIILSYRAKQLPSSMSPWVVAEIGVYGIVLDFWFYWYHRCMHEFDGLWKYHRTHHLTKHPTPLLTLFADFEQEIFDIAVVPFVTYLSMRAMGFPMGFYDWWLCHQYIVFVELFGHSGVRVFLHPPSTNNWFLRLFDAELTIEDHDLHHRKGYRKSHNYGKQTLLWDKAFGTTTDRIEMIPQNIDYDSPAVIPMFPIFDAILVAWETFKVDWTGDPKNLGKDGSELQSP